MSRVTIIDYGLGNLHSVVKALSHIGATVELANNAQAIHDAERLILPGVGAFADGMSGLKKRGFDRAIHEVTAQGTPLLGICLGMQLLFDTSEEFGHHAGLGLIPGRVVRIPQAGVKVPHVGWNKLQPTQPWNNTIFAHTPPNEWAYFVHSYHAQVQDAAHLLADCPYGSLRLAAAVVYKNVLGFQFHPEKSGLAGLGMLAHFCGLPLPHSLTNSVIKDASCVP
jgi:imidazole glycerol-phosphate synthase subunit HisH